MEGTFPKKNNITIFLTVLLLVTACRNQKEKEEPEMIEKTPKTLVKSKQIKESQTHNKIKNISKENLYGVWAENEKDNALYAIEKDSLYFIEHLEDPISYFIISDTLFFDYGNFRTYSIILKADGDSLILKSEYDSEILKLYQRQ